MWACTRVNVGAQANRIRAWGILKDSCTIEGIILLIYTFLQKVVKCRVAGLDLKVSGSAVAHQMREKPPD